MPGGHTWHAIAIHHRARCSGICDASNERIFSLCHGIFDADSGLSPHRVARRVVLKDAGVQCVGGSRDEFLVNEIAAVMRDQFSKSAVRKRKHKTQTLPFKVVKVLDNSEKAAGGRHKPLTDDVSLHELVTFTDTDELVERQTHEPKQLDHESAAALSASMYWTGSGQLRASALPLFAEDKRTLAKFRAPSEIRAKVQNWLLSNEGQNWIQDRQRLSGSTST